MQSNGHDKPKLREWADANMTVVKHQGKGKDGVIFEITKHIDKGVTKHEQTIVINIHQLRALARDFLGG